MSKRGPCLPLGDRMRAFNAVVRLVGNGLGYGELRRMVHRLEGVMVSTTNIRDWTRGLHAPLGKVNEFRARPSLTLAQIIGVRFSDGWLYMHGLGYDFGLNVIDYDLAAQTGRNLAILFRRRTPYVPFWDRYNHNWRLVCRSILLYQFLNQPWQNLTYYIEYSKTCIASFLRAVFDCEGSITGNAVTVYNTDRGFLLYIQRLLKRYFDIDARGPYISSKAGKRIRNPRTGKVYWSRKTCYKLRIRVRSLRLFHRYIGFTIERKRRRLIEAIRR